jgi:hypothetical protein
MISKKLAIFFLVFVFSLILEANNAFSCHLNRLECFKKDVSGGGKCPSPDLYAYDFGGLDSGGCVMGFAVGQFYYCEEVAGVICKCHSWDAKWDTSPSYNGQICKRRCGPLCGLDVKEGKYDFSQSKCVVCSGPIEVGVFGVGGIGNYFPVDTSGDQKCESACGADDECDEKVPESVDNNLICDNKCKAYVCNVKNCGAEMVVSSKIYTCIKDEKGWYWSTTKPSNFCCKNEDCGGNEQCKDNKCVPKCSRNQPSISLKEGEKLTLGCNEEKEITLEIKNEDQNCESSTFQISTSCEEKCTATLATSSLTVSSASAGKTSIKIKPNSEKCENFKLNIIVYRQIEKEKQEVTKEIQVEVSKEVTCSKKGDKCLDKQPCCEGLECINGVCKEKEAQCVEEEGDCSKGQSCCQGLKCIKLYKGGYKCLNPNGFSLYEPFQNGDFDLTGYINYKTAKGEIKTKFDRCPKGDASVKGNTCSNKVGKNVCCSSDLGLLFCLSKGMNCGDDINLFICSDACRKGEEAVCDENGRVVCKSEGGGGAKACDKNNECEGKNPDDFYDLDNDGFTELYCDKDCNAIKCSEENECKSFGGRKCIFNNDRYYFGTPPRKETDCNDKHDNDCNDKIDCEDDACKDKEECKEVTCSKKGEKCLDKQPCCEGLECINGVCKEKEEAECKREYPSLKLEPDTQIAFPGEKLSYKLTIENKDDENCDSSDFQISIECPKEWKCELKKETIKIAPGKSFSTYVFISSPSSQEEGEYEILISVINKENTKYKSEIYATYKIEGKTTLIPIFKGWNMISFPFSDAVLKIEDIKLAKCKIRKYAYAWNASLEKYERFTIFDERLRGRGFWVYSYNKCDLPVHGKNNLEAEEIVLLNKSKNQIPIPEEGLPLLEAKGNCEFINFTYWNASEQATYFWNASTHEFWKYNTTSKKYDIFVKVLDHPFFGKGESAFVYVKEGCSLGFTPPVAMRLKRS